MPISVLETNPISDTILFPASHYCHSLNVHIKPNTISLQAHRVVKEMEPNPPAYYKYHHRGLIGWSLSLIQESSHLYS